MTNLTLRQKINGAILITFIAISLIFISIQMPLQNRRNEELSKRIEVMLHTLVERDREPIANEIYQNLIRALTLRLDQMQELGRFLSISVFDNTGKLLVSRGAYPETQSLTEAEKNDLGGDPQIRYQDHQKQLSMVYSHEIKIIGERIGFIRIYYSLEDMQEEQRLTWMIVVGLLGSILLVMLIFLNLIMSRTIVGPILALSKSMERMRAGNIEQHVYRKSNDEIGKLSNAYSKMSRDLAASYQEVELNRKQLQTARQFLSNILDAMPSMLFGVDKDLKVTHWNLEAERSTGINAEQATGKRITDVFPQIADSVIMIDQALHERSIRKDEHLQWVFDGKPRYMDITVYPLITKGVEGAVIRIDDITIRRLTEEAFRESQEKYRLVVENSNDGIVIVQDGVIKFANPKTMSMLGYSSDGLATLPFVQFVSEEDKATVLGHYTDRMNGKPAPANYSFRIRHKSGNQVWVNTNSVLITWHNRPATLNFLRDITDHKKAEEQLLHAQKMDAIGTLAGGIAHDFNNLLQVIQGYTQLMLFDKKDQAPFHRELEAILRASRKGSELTKQLLTFGRKVEGHPQPVDINAQVEKTERMLSRTIPKMIDIQLHLAENVPPVHVDPGQIDQVLMNLVINARDAMPEGGRILIETETVSLDEDSCKTHLLSTPGTYVRLSISDTGHGISHEVLTHIFEPFFTTKQLGDGTGLGLAIIYGIVKNHNGSIQCYSVPGEGTTFSVYFPTGTATKTLPRERSDLLSDPEGGTETILLVDDEETLRDIGRQILEKFGYTVLLAPDGETALEMYLKQPAQIHLVLLDLIMPGMGGRKCVDELLKVDPDVKIIITSGYFANGDTAPGDGTPHTRGFIKKPFVLESLLREIRRVLDNEKVGEAK